MATVHDVAAYILERNGAMSTMKLQKLVYYAQAWSLVWDDRPLFNAPIEAWANGPVVRELYDLHRGQFLLASWRHGDPNALDEEARGTVNAVLQFYGNENAQWLSDLTHAEDPWRNARQGLADNERGSQAISHADMSEYYSGL